MQSSTDFYDDKDCVFEGITLRQICGGCPESYEASYNGTVCGHMRLRWGHFTVWYEEGDNAEVSEEVYRGYPKGDGIFDCDERGMFLWKGCLRLKARILRPESPSTVSERDLLSLQANCDIPLPPTELTYHLRLAPSGEGDFANEWEDKPHRLLYTACSEIERLTWMVSHLEGRTQ